MALVVIQHDIADQYPVASDFSGDLVAGTLVGLDVDGNIAIAESSIDPIGIAGDTISSDSGGSAYSVDLVISPGGATRSTSNRVSDFFDETKASGFMTVYVGSGKFGTDQFKEDDSDGFIPGTQVFTTSAGKFCGTSDKDNNRPCGYVAKAPTKFPSGVPGTDIESSMSLPGSLTLGEFLTVILSI